MLARSSPNSKVRVSAIDKRVIFRFAFAPWNVFFARGVGDGGGGGGGGSAGSSAADGESGGVAAVFHFSLRSTATMTFRVGRGGSFAIHKESWVTFMAGGYLCTPHQPTVKRRSTTELGSYCKGTGLKQTHLNFPMPFLPLFSPFANSFLGCQTGLPV